MTDCDLFEVGALLIHEGTKEFFLKVIHISERLCPIQLSDINGSAFMRFYLKKTLPKVLAKSLLMGERS